MTQTSDASRIYRATSDAPRSNNDSAAGVPVWQASSSAACPGGDQNQPGQQTGSHNPAALTFK